MSTYGKSGPAPKEVLEAIQVLLSHGFNLTVAPPDAEPPALSPAGLREPVKIAIDLAAVEAYRLQD